MEEVIDNFEFSEFRTFQVFQSKSDLLELIELLNEHVIPFQTEDYRIDFISGASNDRLTHEFILKIREEDFAKVQRLMEDQVTINSSELPSDYYLHSFSNEELMDILGKKDEWNPFDFKFAQQLLQERGIGIADEEIEWYNQQRIEMLSRPQQASELLINTGFVFAFLGGFFGLITGVYLSTASKVLPNGEKVNLFDESSRSKGKTMLLISAISLLFWTLIQLRFGSFLAPSVF